VLGQISPALDRVSDEEEGHPRGTRLECPFDVHGGVYSCSVSALIGERWPTSACNAKVRVPLNHSGNLAGRQSHSEHDYVTTTTLWRGYSSSANLLWEPSAPRGQCTAGNRSGPNGTERGLEI